jgi:hypothetical protein
MNYCQVEKRSANDLCQILSGKFEIITEADVIKNLEIFALEVKEFKSIPICLFVQKNFIGNGNFIDTFYSS